MNDLNNKYSFNELIRKYIPLVGIILLTFLLMIFFKSNKNRISRLIEEGKNNLVAFYTQNLKPLFASTEITNEDVFNFALYQTLPLDKDKKKLLLVSEESNNNQIFEVKDATYIPYTNNYERFTDYLGLNSDQIYRVDSILGAYKKEIYLSVLKSDNNAIAINPKLSDLQKAILADLIAFSEKVNPPKTYNLFPLNEKSININNLISFANLTKEKANNDFIFITPDTVFQTKCEIDAKAFDKLPNNDLNKNLIVGNLRDNFHIKIDLSKPSSSRQKDAKYDPRFFHQVDSNIVRVIVPMPKVPQISYPKFDDSIKVKLEQTADRLKMYSVKWDMDPKTNPERRGRPGPKPLKRGEQFQFHFNFDPEALAKHAVNFSRGNYQNWDKLGVKADSFAKFLEKTISDSLKKSIRNQREKVLRKDQ